MSVGVLGPIIGAIADIPTGGSGSQSTGRGYDIAIGNLFFNLAISDERPYQRATAQFRKDQLDTAPSVGDQSLVGWWTRGQLSFHKGAGINYYEVSEGDAILNRFDEAEGVAVNRPGEVTLMPAWSDATNDTYTSIKRVASTGDNVVVLDSGTLTYGAVGEAGTEYDIEPAVQSFAVGNGDIYTATSENEITRIGLTRMATEAEPEEGFETGAAGWVSELAFGDFTAAQSIEATTTKAFEGSQALEITWDSLAVGDTGAMVRKQTTGLTVGQQYTMVMKVWVPTGLTVFADALFNSTSDAVSSFDQWVTLTHTFTATQGSAIWGVKTTDPTAGDKTWVDKAVLYEGAFTDYDDGATPQDDIYTHSESILDLWFAKDRLIMADATGTFYQLAPDPTSPPVAIGSGDKVFTITGEKRWCLTDTPGPILIGNGNRIFAVSSDASTGALPTLTAPIQVADLPPQEKVLDLEYHLGFVVIVTSAGARVGVLAESGSVTYGPLLFEWTSYPTHTSAGRQNAIVGLSGGSEAYVVDLSQQVGQGLEFAWTNLPNPFGGVEDSYGIAVAPDGRLLAWGDDFVSIQDATNLASSGTLTTGYHRFATLEPKRFESVKIRAAGSGGTIAVSKVDQNGSATPLYTLDASVNHTVDIGLSMTEATEAIALKFTLSRDASDATAGPTLLGYQLRALPQPQRQRLVKIPLQMYDVEQRQPTNRSGRTGSAWARLRELEDLESSGQQVLYRDFRTGETANVYIEQVEFTNTTPPKAGTTGFGGVAFLTIRKLS